LQEILTFISFQWKRQMKKQLLAALVGYVSWVITWEAFHFWLKQQLTVKITKFNRPIFFEDEMLKGTFKSMRHEHHFELSGGITIMTDRFEYTAPLGIIGKLFDLIILKNYMTFLLETRNNLLKSLAEGSGT